MDHEAVLAELAALNLERVTGFKFDDRGRLMVGLPNDPVRLLMRKETREFAQERQAGIEDRVLAVLRTHQPGTWQLQWAKEVVEWLEQVAHTSDHGAVAHAFVNGLKRTCKAFTIDYSQVEQTGCSILSFMLPVADLKADTGLTDAEMAIVKEFIEAIPQDNVCVEIQDVEGFGEVVVLHRYCYIPKEERVETVGEFVSVSLSVGKDNHTILTICE
jgi:hypothetical protein